MKKIVLLILGIFIVQQVMRGSDGQQSGCPVPGMFDPPGTTGCELCIAPMAKVYAAMLGTQSPQSCYGVCMAQCAQLFPCTSTNPCCALSGIPFQGLFCKCNPSLSVCRQAFACAAQCKSSCASPESIANFATNVLLGPTGMCMEIGCTDCFSYKNPIGPKCSKCIHACNPKAASIIANKVLPCIDKIPTTLSEGEQKERIYTCLNSMPLSCIQQCNDTGCGGSGCTDCNVPLSPSGNSGGGTQ